MDPFVIYDGYSALKEKFGDVLHHGDRLERLLNIAKVSYFLLLLRQVVNARSMRKCLIASEHQEFYDSFQDQCHNWGEGLGVGG